MDTGDEGSSLGTCSSISMSLISFVGDILDLKILTSNESGSDHEV